MFGLLSHLSLPMPAVSLLATVVAAIAGFALGGIWYGPLFGKVWMEENKLTRETAMQGFNPAMANGTMSVLSLVASYVFGMFLGGVLLGGLLARDQLPV
jgi:uncharacterized membrane protein YciS (DUF1049 family)